MLLSLLLPLTVVDADLNFNDAVTARAVGAAVTAELLVLLLSGRLEGI